MPLSDADRRAMEAFRARTSANVSSGSGQAYKPLATNILAQRLRQISQSGTPQQVQQAKRIAGGGALSTGAKTLGAVGAVLGTGMRAVEASAEAALGLNQPGEKNWWGKVTDPSYSAADIIEKVSPDAPSWVKAASGFGVDVAADPLSWFTLGGTTALGKTGRAVKLARWAEEAAATTKVADEAVELRRIGAIAGRSPWKLTAEDLDKIALGNGMERDALRYGARLHVPFTHYEKFLGGGLGAEQAAKGIEAAGTTLSRTLRESQWGSKLSGNLADIRNWVSSGNPVLHRLGLHMQDALHAGGEASSNSERDLRIIRDALRTERERVGLDPTDVFHALEERARLAKDGTAIEGGDLWNRIVQNPEQAKVMEAYARHIDAIPGKEGLAAQWAKHGDVVHDFIFDTTDESRAYVPHVMSDEFMTRFGKRFRQKVRLGDTAFFEQQAIKPGNDLAKAFEAGYGEHLPGGKLADPGTLLDDGTRAPGLSQQMQAAVDAAHGDKAVQWFTDDIDQVMEKYHRTLAHQVGNYKTQNYLLAKGVIRETPTSLAETLQHAATSNWRDDLFGDWVPNQGKTAYTGKGVNQTLYGLLQRELDGAHDGLRAISDQFTMHVDDMHDTLNRVQQIEDELKLAPVGSRRQDLLQARLAAYEDARDAFAMRDQLSTQTEKQIAHLEGRARELEAAKMGEGDIDWDKLLKDSPGLQKKMTKVLHQGWEGFGFGRQAPADVVEVLKRVDASFDMSTGEGLDRFLRHYDPLHRWIKGWLVTSPGFHVRNFFGGTFNNWLAGVNIRRSTTEWGNIYRKFFPMSHEGAVDLALAHQMVPEGVTHSEHAVFDIMNQLGLVESGRFRSEIGRGEAISRWNPFAGVAGGPKQFTLNYHSQQLGQRFVEPLLRGTLGHDRLIKAVEAGRFAEFTYKGQTFKIGKSLENITDEATRKAFVDTVMNSPLAREITDDVHKFHFDYNDLSGFERKVGRRIIPFYTWTRKNVPLQLEMLATQPGKTFNRYMAIKRNLESMSPEEQIVPSYFAEMGFIRLPFAGPGGRAYATVDLPFKDPFKVADVTGQLGSMISPLIKAPIEAGFGRQMFGQIPLTERYKPIPATWLPMVPLMEVLGRVPFAPFDPPIRDQQGNWMLRDKDHYLLGQYMPFMQQIERIVPVGGRGAAAKYAQPTKYQRRYLTTMASWMFGLTSKTNTPQDMETEIFRRTDPLTSMVNRMKDTGQIRDIKPKRRKPGRRIDLTELLTTVTPRQTDFQPEGEIPAQTA